MLPAQNERQPLWKTGKVPGDVSDEGNDAARTTAPSAHRNPDQGLGDAVLEPSGFTLIEEIGEGSSSTVYLGHFRETRDAVERAIALKVLKPQVLTSEKDVEEFLKEATALKRIRHPSIVEFVGVTKTEFGCKAGRATMALAQEYMNMGNMKTLILDQMEGKSRNSLNYTKRDALKWMLDIAKALQYLHRLEPRVVHRNVKPENLLLCKDDAGEVVAKLADVGLQAMVPSPFPERIFPFERMLDQFNANTFVNSSEEAKLELLEAHYSLSYQTGSLLYMAPEVVRCGQYDEKGDVFSFASVLYELLQGATMMTFISPTPSTKNIEAYMMAVESGFRPTIPGVWPAEINGLIADCWEDAPLARPKMSEVVERLQIMYNDGMFVRKGTAATLFRAFCC